MITVTYSTTTVTLEWGVKAGSKGDDRGLWLGQIEGGRVPVGTLPTVSPALPTGLSIVMRERLDGIYTYDTFWLTGTCSQLVSGTSYTVTVNTDSGLASHTFTLTVPQKLILTGPTTVITANATGKTSLPVINFQARKRIKACVSGQGYITKEPIINYTTQNDATGFFEGTIKVEFEYPANFGPQQGVMPLNVVVKDDITSPNWDNHKWFTLYVAPAPSSATLPSQTAPSSNDVKLRLIPLITTNVNVIDSYSNESLTAVPAFEFEAPGPVQVHDGFRMRPDVVEYTIDTPTFTRGIIYMINGVFGPRCTDAKPWLSQEGHWGQHLNIYENMLGEDQAAVTGFPPETKTSNWTISSGGTMRRLITEFTKKVGTGSAIMFMLNSRDQYDSMMTKAMKVPSLSQRPTLKIEAASVKAPNSGTLNGITNVVVKLSNWKNKNLHPWNTAGGATGGMTGTSYFAPHGGTSFVTGGNAQLPVGSPPYGEIQTMYIHLHTGWLVVGDGSCSDKQSKFEAGKYWYTIFWASPDGSGIKTIRALVEFTESGLPLCPTATKKIKNDISQASFDNPDFESTSLTPLITNAPPYVPPPAPTPAPTPMPESSGTPSAGTPSAGTPSTSTASSTPSPGGGGSSGGGNVYVSPPTPPQASATSSTSTVGSSYGNFIIQETVNAGGQSKFETTGPGGNLSTFWYNHYSDNALETETSRAAAYRNACEAIHARINDLAETATREMHFTLHTARHGTEQNHRDIFKLFQEDFRVLKKLGSHRRKGIVTRGTCVPCETSIWPGAIHRALTLSALRDSKKLEDVLKEIRNPTTPEIDQMYNINRVSDDDVGFDE